MVKLCSLLLFLLSQFVPTVFNKGPTGSAPTFVTSAAGFTFSTPETLSVGTVNVNDIVYYMASATTNGATFTMTLTGSCAASGGNVTDAGPTNQGAAAGDSQAGHLVITTGGSCTVSEAYTGAGDGIVSVAVIRGSSGLDQATTINNQNSPGTGSDAVVSGSVTTTAKDLCIGATVDMNDGAGTLTAGTTIAWTLGSKDNTFPNGNEDFAQSSSGSIQATFGYTVSPFSQTQMSCFKP